MRIIFLISLLILISGCQTIRQVKNYQIFTKQEKTSPSINQSTTQNHNLEADECYKNHDYKRAAKLYYDLFSRNAEQKYLLLAANSYRYIGEFEQAKNLYEQIIYHYSTKEILLAAKEGKSLCLIEEGNFKEAITTFKEIIAEDASRWKTINALAVILALNNHYKEAIEYFNIALDLSNSPPGILNNLGLTLALDGKKDQAQKTLEQASTGLPPFYQHKGRIDLNLALVYGINGNMAKAEAICRKYLTDEQTYNNMSFYANLAKDKKMANEYLNKALAAQIAPQDM
jgi:Flp pilus assembly protein TadD